MMSERRNSEIGLHRADVPLEALHLARRQARIDPLAHDLGRRPLGEQLPPAW